MSEEQKPKVVIEKAGDNVYYNVTFTNQSPGLIPIPLNFQEIRKTRLLPGPTNEYQMSVVKFDVPTDLIPIQFFPIKDGSLDQSTYEVAMSWTVFTINAPLIWIPQESDPTTPIPQPPYLQSQQQFYHDYYSLYNYEHFMKMINASLLAAHNQMVLDGAPVLAGVPPFMYFEPTTNLISLYAPVQYDSDLANPVKIYLNADLASNFGFSFPSIINSHQDPTGLDLQLLVHDNIINRQTIAGNDYYVMSQEFISLPLMLDFTSIVLASNSIPARNELVSVQGIETNGFSSILSDFHVLFDIGTEIRDRVTYLPTAQFRYITLQSDTPIETIDLQFYWKGNDNVLYPIFLSAFREASVKILFEKK